MVSFSNHIIFDKIDTWPKEIINLLELNKASIKGFLREEHRIDNEAEKDVALRYKRPINKFEYDFESAIFNIESILQNYSIVGIHCTKLLSQEIIDVQINGLRPLDVHFANQRVEKAYNMGLISKQLKEELIDKKELKADNRRGKIYVFHCLSTLKDEWGLNRLLGYWGGESLYAYAKNRKELRSIGIPCIVFASIKINELDIYPALSKRMTAFYFNDIYYPYDTDSRIKNKLDVLRIITREEKIFEDLTEIQRWDDEID